MQNLNTDILSSRITSLMQEKKINQADLAAEIDMTQPNFSRAINNKNGQCFTLEQVYKLAQYFEVSVDYLLGNTKPANKQSEKDICEFFISLIESRKLVTIEHTREEEIYTPIYRDRLPDCDITKEQVTYTSFLFPSYFDPGPLDRLDEDQIDNLRQDVLFGGNNDDSNIRINAFFTRYLQIYNMFVHNQMKEELFHEITKKFLDDLQ